MSMELVTDYVMYVTKNDSWIVMECITGTSNLFKFVGVTKLVLEPRLTIGNLS
jgi:hypothetical protein